MMAAKKITHGDGPIYTTDVMIYPHNNEDRPTIKQLLLTALESYEVKDAPWRSRFRGRHAMACSVYGTKDEIVSIEKKVRRLSRGKVRFDFETTGLWTVAVVDGVMINEVIE